MNIDICIPQAVLGSIEYRKLSAKSKVLLVSLWVYKNQSSDDNRILISHDQMEITSGLPHSSVIRAIRELRQTGFVWNPGGHRSRIALADIIGGNKHGSLTQGQLKIIATLQPMIPRPRTILSNGQITRLVKIREKLGLQDPRCYVCGMVECLELHHVNYCNFGYETTHDLVLLCARCHDRVHNR